MFAAFSRLSQSAKIALHATIFVVVFVLLLKLLASLDWGLATVTSISTALGIFYLRFADETSKGLTTVRQRVVAIKTGRYHTHPVLAILYTFAWLQLVANLTQGVLSYSATAAALEAMKSSPGPLDGEAQRRVVEIAQSTTSYTTIAVGVIAMIPIAIFITHRVKRLALLWIFIALVLSISFSISASYLLGLVGGLVISMLLVVSYAALVAVYMLSAAVGWWYAIYTQEHYLLNRISRQLPVAVRRTLIDLADEELATTKSLTSAA